MWLLKHPCFTNRWHVKYSEFLTNQTTCATETPEKTTSENFCQKRPPAAWASAGRGGAATGVAGMWPASSPGGPCHHLPPHPSPAPCMHRQPQQATALTSMQHSLLCMQHSLLCKRKGADSRLWSFLHVICNLWCFYLYIWCFEALFRIVNRLELSRNRIRCELMSSPFKG
jgi:hypothetical protein